MASVRSLESATLSDAERTTLRRFVELLGERLGDDLVSVWLYGSRARGEPPHDESDVDVIVVTARGGADRDRVWDALWDAGHGDGADPYSFSIQVFDPRWVAGRREIRSFYLHEVDRDKIVLSGTP